jgi:hypothetical protein
MLARTSGSYNHEGHRIAEKPAPTEPYVRLPMEGQ